MALPRLACRAVENSEPCVGHVRLVEELGEPTVVQLTEQPFSAIEQAVIKIANQDRLSSVKPKGRLTGALQLLFGFRRRNSFANAKLEILRQTAVLIRHHGNLRPVDVVTFYQAGFTPEHIEALNAACIGGKAHRRL